ncbi:MAG: NAD-dependent epimerase/dehydratase family protein, partial [Chitinophagaceae bacterium]
AEIALGMQDKLWLGNLNAKRDWGHAKDYVEAMWLILQQETAEDFVIATGKTTTVRDFVSMAFLEVGINLEFKGEGEAETAVVTHCSNPEFQIAAGTCVVAVDKHYYRPTEVDLLIGDPTKANTKLGWKPKYDLPDMIKEMVAADVQLMRLQVLLKEKGYTKTIS